MNELNLVKILKNAPEGTPLYSTIFGNVTLAGVSIESCTYPIYLNDKNNCKSSLTIEGLMSAEYEGECLLWPSKECRDWSKFNPNAPIPGNWYLFWDKSAKNALLGMFSRIDGNRYITKLGVVYDNCAHASDWREVIEKLEKNV